MATEEKKYADDDLAAHKRGEDDLAAILEMEEEEFQNSEDDLGMLLEMEEEQEKLDALQLPDNGKDVDDDDDND